MKRQILKVCTILVLAVSVNFADENATRLDDIKTYELGAVEIIAHEEVDSNPTATTISAQEFKESGAVDIGQAVSRSAGVYFREGVGSRARSTLFVRGYNSGQIGFYLDGISIKSIYGGGIDTSFFSLGGIGGVQILRGFTSPEYNMNSLGAAINMSSMRPEKEFEFTAETRFITSDGATGKEWQKGLSVGTMQKSFYVRADYFQRDRDAYALSKDYTQGFDAIKGYAYNSYFHSKTFRLKVGFVPNENNEYSLNYLISKGSKGGLLENGTSTAATDYANVSYLNYPIYDQQFVYLLGLSYLTPDIYLDSKLYYRDFADALTETQPQNTFGYDKLWGEKFNDESYGGIVTLNFDINQNSNAKLGVNINYAHHYKSYSASPDNQNYTRQMTQDMSEVQTSLFAQYAQGLWSKFRVVFAGSLDRADTLKLYSDYNYGASVGSLSARQSIKPHLSVQGILYYDFAENNSLHINIGRKHNLPTLSQRYGSEMAEYAANPDLEPESAINYELGYDLAYKSTNFSVAVFYNDMKNMFDNTLTGSAQVDKGNCSNSNTSWEFYCYMQKNIDHGYTYGGEVALQQGFLDNDMLTLGVNYSYIYKHADGYDVNLRAGRKLTDYPNHIFNAKVKLKATKKLDIIAQSVYQSAPLYANLDSTGSTKTGGYFTRGDGEYIVVDISANYAASKNLSVSAGVYNVADRDNYKLVVPSKQYRSETPYVEQHYAGRRFFAGVEYRY